MKLKGKYIHEIIKFKDCELLIENGLIHRVIVDLPPINAFSYPPKDKSDFKLEKLPSEKGLAPTNSNYLIEYIGKSNSVQKIYLNLSSLQLFKLKWQLKKFVIQDRSLKLDAIKYIIGIVIGSIGTLLFQSQDDQVNTEPEAPYKQEIKKSIEEKKPQKEYYKKIT